MGAILIRPSLFIFIVHTLFMIVENVHTRRRNDMVLEGPVLIYGRISNNNFVLNDSTIINYPEKIPVVWNYEFDNPNRLCSIADKFIAVVITGVLNYIHHLMV